MAALTVDDLDELRTLHRMLFTRKFDGPEDEFFGSPYVAAVQRRLLAVLSERERHQDWDRWADASGHTREVEKVRSYLVEAGAWWERAATDERRSFVLDLLSPLRPTDQLLGELVATAQP